MSEHSAFAVMFFSVGGILLWEIFVMLGMSITPVTYLAFVVLAVIAMSTATWLLIGTYREK